jgi:hypothetical protein
MQTGGSQSRNRLGCKCECKQFRNGNAVLPFGGHGRRDPFAHVLQLANPLPKNNNKQQHYPYSDRHSDPPGRIALLESFRATVRWW